jgi:hypothetical protein
MDTILPWFGAKKTVFPTRHASARRAVNTRERRTVRLLHQLPTLSKTHEDSLRGRLRNRALEVGGDVDRSIRAVHLEKVRRACRASYRPTYALDILQDSILGYECMTVLQSWLDGREVPSADGPSCPLSTAILAKVLALDIVVETSNNGAAV